jgi:GTP-binding protein of the ras superfamily involved in termination of M-phase
MEKVIEMPKGDIMFSIWDLGGQREYQHMLPIVCNEANVLLFMFDLTRKATLTSVKQWYQSARKNNKTAIPFLIGTKFDQFITQRDELIADVTRQVRTYILLL